MKLYPLCYNAFEDFAMETIIHILAQIGGYFAIAVFVITLYYEYTSRGNGCLTKLLHFVLLCGSVLLFIVCKHYAGT